MGNVGMGRVPVYWGVLKSVVNSRNTRKGRFSYTLRYSSSTCTRFMMR